MPSRTTVIACLFFMASCLSPLPALADTSTPATAGASSELTVSPVVVDEKAKARDILKETLTLKNNSTRTLELYPSVNDVENSDGAKPFVEAQSGEERSGSLANWIEVSRGVINLPPGQSVDVPFIIRVNLNALPGTYHADISFYEGSNRADAEAKHPLGVATVNTEVQADIKEAMQLNKFITDSFFFSGDDVLFNYQLQNIGNQELKPKGEIRIYDRSGHEVASVPVNADGKSLSPDQSAQLASAWSAAKGFGKFKAFLNVDYGDQNAAVQDTVFFWIIPWQQLLIIFIASAIAIIIAAIYFHRWLEHKHLQKFAAVHGIAPQGAAAAMPLPPMALAPMPSASAPAVSSAAVSAMSVMPKPEQKAAPKEKRRWFGLRAAKKTASRIESAAPAPAAERPVVAAPEPVPSAPAAPEPVRRAPQAHTIDLSKTSIEPEQKVRHEGRVINLKNGV